MLEAPDGPEVARLQGGLSQRPFSSPVQDPPRGVSFPRSGKRQPAGSLNTYQEPCRACRSVKAVWILAEYVPP